MIKKKVLISIAVLTLISAIHAQTTIDMVKYRCTYKTITVKDTTDTNHFSEDIMRLDIGSKVNYFYSQRKQERDLALAKATESGVLDRGMVQSAPKGVNKYDIYQNCPEKKISFLNELATRRTKYMYEEDAFIPGWEVLSMKKKILDYTCQAASCRYRGRNYIAWFTTELPFSFGPWKFGGLPGLILQISDEKGHYAFEAIGFEKITNEVPIVFNAVGYKKMSRKDYMKMEKDFLRDPIAWISQSIGIKIEGVNTPQGRQKEGIREDHYAPLELE